MYPVRLQSQLQSRIDSEAKPATVHTMIEPDGRRADSEVCAQGYAYTRFYGQFVRFFVSFADLD